MPFETPCILHLASCIFDSESQFQTPMHLTFQEDGEVGWDSGGRGLGRTQGLPGEETISLEIEPDLTMVTDDHYSCEQF